MSKRLFMDNNRCLVRSVVYNAMGQDGKKYVNRSNTRSFVWTPDRLQELCNFTRNITGHWSKVY